MNDWIQKLTEITIAGNELWRPLALCAVIFISLLIGRLVQCVLRRLADRFDKAQKDLVAVVFLAFAKSTPFFFFVLGPYIGLHGKINLLVMSASVQGIADTVNTVLITFALGWVIYCLVEVVDAWLGHFASRTESKLDDMIVPMVRKSLKVTIVILVLVQVAQILSDKPLTSIIAGLGVGGLAVALAAQDTLKNFFGSLVIFADKPFEMGDRIVVDGYDGPVEEVGFRSTRVRTLDGHLVTIPNGALANKTLQNIGKRPYIKRTANITITYDTPPDKVERAVEMIQEILHNHEGMNPDFPPRVYFNEFNDVSLNIMMIYWYHPPNYWDFCAFNERINMEILRRFNEAGIEFAFPTQTLFLAGDPKRPLQTG